MTSIKDIYWLAGILEGEGCFYTSLNMRHSGRSYIINLKMNDIDIVKKCSSILRGEDNIRYYMQEYPNKPNWNATYSTFVSGRIAIAWMMTLYSLLGQRRKARIREIIKEWKEYADADIVRKRRLRKSHKPPIREGTRVFTK